MANNLDVVIRPSKLEDREAVLGHLRNFFFRDEPCNRSLRVVTDERPICEDMEKFVLQFFNNGLNFVAELDGKIVGVGLNFILERGQECEEFPVKDETFVKVVRLLEYGEKQADFFTKYPDVDKILYIFVLSVDTDVRGKGLAKKLVNEAKEIGREKGAQLIAIDCTSYYSANAAASLGFDRIWSMNYADYKVNGEVVIQPAPPHTALQIFVSRL